jgi:hypothetical protein
LISTRRLRFENVGHSVGTGSRERLLSAFHVGRCHLDGLGQVGRGAELDYLGVREEFRCVPGVCDVCLACLDAILGAIGVVRLQRPIENDAEVNALTAGRTNCALSRNVAATGSRVDNVTTANSMNANLCGSTGQVSGMHRAPRTSTGYRNMSGASP